MAQTTREAPERQGEQQSPPPPEAAPKKSLEERVEALEATLARARILLGED